MTSAVASPVHVWVDEGVLSALCEPCGVYAEHVGATAEAAAREAFRRVHPDSAEPHTGALPDGWVQPLSGPGALSQ